MGYSAVSQTMSTLIMFFGTSVVGIPGTLVGLCIAIGTMWDAITDPIIGYISDNSTSSQFGSRQKFMAVATLFMALCNIMLWSVPLNLSVGQKFAWLLVCLILFETADTFYATPYSALGYEMCNVENQSSSLQAIKSVFYLIGMMLPSVLMALLMQDTTNKSSYINIGMTTSCLMVICSLFCILSLIRKNNNYIVNDKKSSKKQTFWHAFSIFFDFFKNKQYLFVILGYSISMLATALLTSLGMHVFTYSFHFSSKQISLILLCLIFGAMIAQLFVSKLSNKYGKTKTLIHFIILTILGIGLISIIFTLRILLPTKLNFILICPLIAFCGFGSGALYSIPFAIFSDIINNENNNNQTNQTATFSGVMTFVFKLSNAISLFIIGLILDLIKFDSNQPVQALKVQNSLGTVMIFGVAISLALSIYFFSKYDSNKKIR